MILNRPNKKINNVFDFTAQANDAFWPIRPIQRWGIDVLWVRVDLQLKTV